jgi:hypothetical protein
VDGSITYNRARADPAVVTVDASSPRSQASQPATRVVLLGGSNLARGISTIVQIARRMVGGPIEFLIAMGHGRSYGRRSTVLGRSLPGITECGLWEVLHRHDGRTTYALVTDVGNDVAYGASVESIVGWVEACLDHLAGHDTCTVMTPLPMASLERLGPWRYHIARTILFPGRHLPMASALARARELNDGLASLGRRRDIRLVEHDDRWYGLDPIHIRWGHLPSAWTRVLSAWQVGEPAVGHVRRSTRRWLHLRTMTPQRWWLLGFQLGRLQPAGSLPDGSTVSLF